MTNRIISRLMAGILLGAICLVQSLSAEERFIATSENFTVSVPMPGFAALGPPEESRQSGVGQSGYPIVIDELIPAGESFDNWLSLFAIKLEESVALTMDEYVGQLKTVYFNACENLFEPMIFSFEDQDALKMFVIPCGSYVDDPSRGEVAIFTIYKFGQNYLNVYQHWRGAAFNAMDPTSWPVTPEQMDVYLANATDIDLESRN